MASERKSRSVFDSPPDAIEEARLDAVAEAELEAGGGVPHERVRLWLASLAKGEKSPPPEA